MKKLLFLIAIVAFVGTTVSANVQPVSDNNSIVVVDNDFDNDNDQDKDKDKKKKKKSKKSSCCDTKGDKNCGTSKGKANDPSCQEKASKKSCCPGHGSAKAAKAEPAKPE